MNISQRNASTTHAALDAATLLNADHIKFEKWIDQFKLQSDIDQKRTISSDLIRELYVDMELEARLLLPLLDNVHLLQKIARTVRDSHLSLQKFITKIQEACRNDAFYDEFIYQLGREFRRYRFHEVLVVFPALRENFPAELATIMVEMQALKDELLGGTRPG